MSEPNASIPVPIEPTKGSLNMSSPTRAATARRFNDRVAVVTGAASGIGRATALRLAEEGARVVAVDLAEDTLATLAEESTGFCLVAVATDITAPDAADRILEAAGGRADLLVNNAGIMDGFVPIAEVIDEAWDRVFAVNVNAPMRLIRAVLPGMLETGRGSIVNVASEAALRGSASGAAYAASKHAIVGLTKNTAVVYGARGVRCNAVAPGPVRTGIEGGMRSEDAARVLGPIMQATVPAVAEPEDLASVITWVASDEARNVNGAVLASDGGWSAV